jgi:hypothetical protein
VAREKLKKKIATYKNGVVIRKQEVERAKEAFAKDEADLAKLKGEEKMLQGLVDKLKGLAFVSIGLEPSAKVWYMEQMHGFCSFVVEMSSHLCRAKEINRECRGRRAFKKREGRKENKRRS